MNLLLDTSAFAKRYVSEHGSKKVLALCAQADSLTVSVICLPEFISTLTRLVREKRLNQTDYQNLKFKAITDLADIDICQLTQDVLASALNLLESNQLRAMDALHIACALRVGADKFVSADHRQLKAARNAGLVTVDVS